MTLLKRYILIFMLPLCLSSCAKSIFFGEKGGADAYGVGAELDPLKEPLKFGGALPVPEERKPYAPLPSKVVKASELLGINRVASGDNITADAILKGKTGTDLDFDAFDSEMQATYETEEKSRENSVIDTVLGRDESPIDPVLNETEDDRIFSF